MVKRISLKEEAEQKVAEMFDSANEIPGLPELPSCSPGLSRIVESVFSVDILELYDKIEGQLAIANALTPEAVRAALNKADDNARVAHQIYVIAKIELDKLKLEYSKVESAMRDSAVKELTNDKAVGLRSKMITEADVTAKVIEMFPDEYVAMITRKSKETETLEHLRRLADLWQQRCRTLTSLNNY
ncbi:MAG: hypothetical protein KGL39_18220 [Patescibacteria group bacterium]|nr:hypothetical protein [Patescibacteria group bacterium]